MFILTQCTTNQYLEIIQIPNYNWVNQEVVYMYNSIQCNSKKDEIMWFLWHEWIKKAEYLLKVMNTKWSFSYVGLIDTLW